MIEFAPAANLIVWTLSVTVVFFALDLWRRIAETARTFGEPGRTAAARVGIVLAAWLALAFLATFVPELGRSIVYRCCCSSASSSL